MVLINKIDINTKIQKFLKTKMPGISLGVFVFAILLIGYSKHFMQPLVPAQKNLIAPPQGLEHFSFGFQETIADSLWIRSIQDFDYCDQPMTAKQCKGNSWLYQMLDVTTSLSPRFRMPYATGALALTILITDVDGATKLFDKGVEAFPNDWPIAYRAAYHYLYEVDDKKHAADLLLRAAKNGGPKWLPSLANRLYVDTGNTELAEALLRDMIQQNADPQLIKRIEEKIDSTKTKAKISR